MLEAAAAALQRSTGRWHTGLSVMTWACRGAVPALHLAAQAGCWLDSALLLVHVDGGTPTAHGEPIEGSWLALQPLHRLAAGSYYVGLAWLHTC